MKISALKILELNSQFNLLGDLAERELNNPEGSGVDLRVGSVHKIVGDSFLAADGSSRERYSPKTEIIGDTSTDGNKMITLKPGEYFLVTTMETVNSPSEKIKFDDSFPECYLIPK